MTHFDHDDNEHVRIDDPVFDWDRTDAARDKFLDEQEAGK